MLGTSGLSTAGIPLVVKGQTVCIFASLSNILSDGDGLRQALSWRGASSTKPCFKHYNVLRKDSDLAHRRPGFVEIDSHSCSDFRSLSKDEMYAMVDAVEAAHTRADVGEAPRGVATDLEFATGLNRNPRGLLSPSGLRQSSSASQGSRAC